MKNQGVKMKKALVVCLLGLAALGCGTSHAQTVVEEVVYIEKPVIKEKIVYKTKIRYVPRVVYKWRTRWKTRVVYRCPSPKYKEKVIYKHY